MPLRCDHGPDLNPTQHCYPIHSLHPPGWTCLCAEEADHLLPAQGPTGGVWGCVCVCLSINNNLRMQLHRNNNLFYPFPISHPFRSSVWLGVRSEVLGGQGSYSLFFSQSPPSSLRRFGCSFELDSCQELSWQLSWTEKKERKYPPDLA